MIKRTIFIILSLSLLFPLCGCWNYRGLDEMSIVVGIAVDKNHENENYNVTFELIDLAVPIEERGLASTIVESEGKTLFDAVRNAKMRVTSKLYFGQVLIAVISEEIARNQDISGIIDWFLRDHEFREDIKVIISKEESAHDILASKSIGQDIVSKEIFEIIDADNEVTSSVVAVEFYEAFNAIKAEGKSLAMPAFHNVQNNGKSVVEASGTAVFKENRLVGFLSPDETKYFLFATDKIKGGLLTFSSEGKTPHNISLEISKNKTKTSYNIEDGNIKVLISTDTTVYLDEVMGQLDSLDAKQISALEAIAEANLEAKIHHVIKKVQAEYGSDIFGFGNMIY